MSLSSATNRVDYTGNGATSVYAYTFYIVSKSDLTVTRTTTAGVETTLTVDTDYTVSTVGAASGGNVTLLAGSLTSGYKLTIRRVLALTQPTDIRHQGSFYPDTHEDAFDRMVMLSQQVQEQVSRSVKNPVSLPSSTFDPTLPAGIAAASLYLKTNTAGTGWEVASAASAASFWYPSINMSSEVPPSGLPTGSGAFGYDADLQSIGIWIPALSKWKNLGGIAP